MTLDESIKHAEEVSDFHEYNVSRYDMNDPFENHMACQDRKYAEEHRQIAEWLKELKQLKEQPMWIPVSERLPELYTFVYATCHSLVDDREDWVIETCYVPIPKEYNSRRFSDWGNIPMLNHGEAEVIAWMKRDIPEPYKAESEDKE